MLTGTKPGESGSENPGEHTDKCILHLTSYIFGALSLPKNILDGNSPSTPDLLIWSAISSRFIGLVGFLEPTTHLVNGVGLPERAFAAHRPSGPLLEGLSEVKTDLKTIDVNWFR